MKLDGRQPNQPKLTREEILDILSKISIGHVLYKEPKFRLLDSGDGFLIQLVYLEEDCDTGREEEQHARKWYVSAHSTPTEVVRTAYKAVMTSLEHRLGEWFTFNGERVYSPHRSVE